MLYGDDVSGVHGYGHLTGGCVCTSTDFIQVPREALRSGHLSVVLLLTNAAPRQHLQQADDDVLLWLVPCRHEGGQAEYARVMFGAPYVIYMLLWNFLTTTISAGNLSLVEVAVAMLASLSHCWTGECKVLCPHVMQPTST